MTEQQPFENEPARIRKPWRRWLFWACAFLATAALGVVLLLQSNYFHERVRRLLVESLQQATGMRVELGAFSFHWPRLEVQLQGLVLHGRETPQEPPLFSADWIEARWNLVSIWNLDADLTQVRVLGPKVYITVDENGQSNIPTLPRVSSSRGRWAEQLLRLQILRLEVLRGEFRWNQRRIPLDFRAEHFQVRLDYEPTPEHYAGRLDYRNAVLTASDARELASRGRVQFNLYQDHAEIDSFEWQSDKSRLNAQGTVQNFASPQLASRFDLFLDWQDAGMLVRNRGWEGDIQLRGDAYVDSSDWRLEGGLEVRTVRNGVAAWSHVPWTARGLLRVAKGVEDSESSEETDSAGWQATLQNLEVNTLGGRLLGSALIRPGSPGPISILNLTAERLSFPALTQAMRTLPVRLERLQWAGVVSGPVQVRFVGPGRNLTLEADCEVVLPSVVPPGFTPISGRLRGRYDATAKRLESRDSYIDLPNTHMSGTGWFQELESEMQLAWETTDLEENKTLAELAWRGAAAQPVTLHGRATAQVLWTGGTRQARLNGNLDATDFSYQDTRWDAFAGRLDYRRNIVAPGAETAAEVSEVLSPDDFRFGVAELRINSGQLRKGGAAMDFDLRLGLENGRFEAQSPFSLSARIRNAQFQDLQQIAGRQFPLRASVDSSVELSGTREEPVGRGTVTLSDGALYEEPFDRLTAEMRLERGSVLVADPIRVTKDGAAFQGRVRFQRPSEAIEFDVSGSDVPLESVRILQRERVRIAGMATGRFSGSGSLRRPRVQGQLAIRELQIGTAPPGQLSIGLQTQDGKALWTFNGNFLGGEARGTGETILEDPFALTANADFDNLDLPIILQVFRESPAELHGSLGGSLRAEGNWKDLRALTLQGQVQRLEAEFRGADIRNAEAIPFRYQNELLNLQRVHLLGEQTDLEASGTVRLVADPVFNLAAKGRMDLRALGVIDQQLDSSGDAQLDAQLNGTLRRPQWRGRVVLSGARLYYGSLPNGFEDVNGAIVFDGNRGVLEGFRAESGGGRVQMTGFLQYVNDTGLQFDLSAQVTSVRVRYPEGLSTWVDGQVSWVGTLESSLIEGRLVMSRQSVGRNFDLVQSLLRRNGEPDSLRASPFLGSLRLNLEIQSAPEIRLDTLTARNLQTDVELRIQGTAAQPVWLGRIGILQGEIFFAGRRYDVNRGEITFLNPVRLEPILNLSVQARVQRYDITMDFSGPPDRLTVTYRSDPPLPARDILNLLVAGNPRETPLDVSAAQGVPQVGADSLLTQALRTQIGSRLDRLFGSGRFRVDPQISGIGRSTSASIALEQQLSDELSILYVTDVTSSQQQLIQAEWTISPKLSVVGIRDENGLIGVNFQITLRFR